jgi:hypothetical protein
LNLPRSTTFSKEENVFGIYALYCWFDLRKTRGLFNKITPKGYPAIWTVGSDPNDPDLKERGRGRRTGRRRRPRGGAPLPVARRLTGVSE